MNDTRAFYSELMGDNAEALSFLAVWNQFCHAVDDQIDAPAPPPPENQLATLSQAALVYSHPFYQRHADRLLPIVLLATSHYADSLAMTASAEPWQQTWGDTLRFAGNLMVETVILMVSGYDALRRHSLELRRRAWTEHHDPATGAPC